MKNNLQLKQKIEKNICKNNNKYTFWLSFFKISFSFGFLSFCWLTKRKNNERDWLYDIVHQFFENSLDSQRRATLLCSMYFLMIIKFLKSSTEFILQPFIKLEKTIRNSYSPYLLSHYFINEIPRIPAYYFDNLKLFCMKG